MSLLTLDLQIAEVFIVIADELQNILQFFCTLASMWEKVDPLHNLLNVTALVC